MPEWKVCPGSGMPMVKVDDTRLRCISCDAHVLYAYSEDVNMHIALRHYLAEGINA